MLNTFKSTHCAVLISWKKQTEGNRQGETGQAKQRFLLDGWTGIINENTFRDEQMNCWLYIFYHSSAAVDSITSKLIKCNTVFLGKMNIIVHKVTLPPADTSNIKSTSPFLWWLETDLRCVCSCFAKPSGRLHRPFSNFSTVELTIVWDPI